MVNTNLYLMMTHLIRLGLVSNTFTYLLFKNMKGRNLFYVCMGHMALAWLIGVFSEAMSYELLQSFYTLLGVFTIVLYIVVMVYLWKN